MSSPTGTAHPRAGGENVDRKHVNDAMRGSSPRGRGKPGVAGLIPARAGLIPARAGKTRFLWPGRQIPAAHPRAGGENRAEIAAIQTRAGSSPRGRGKRE